MSEGALHWVTLDPLELEILGAGLTDWGVPAGPIRVAELILGYASAEECINDLAAMRSLLPSGGPLTKLQWTRVLLAAELVFASAVVGSRLEWNTIHNGWDGEWFAALDRLQTKVPYDVNLLLL